MQSEDQAVVILLAAVRQSNFLIECPLITVCDITYWAGKQDHRLRVTKLWCGYWNIYCTYNCLPVVLYKVKHLVS